jgi:hypothetical protein
MWKTIPTYPNYEVSDLGEVRRVGSAKLLRPSTLQGTSVKGNRLPYQRVNFKNKGKLKHVLVHRLVLEAFVGPCPEGFQCLHLDNNPKNNHLNNLRWGTPKENNITIDRKGESHGMAKLTNVDVLLIRSSCRTQKEIAKQFNMSISTINKILKRRTWQHV